MLYDHFNSKCVSHLADKDFTSVGQYSSTGKQDLTGELHIQTEVCIYTAHLERNKREKLTHDQLARGEDSGGGGA